MEATEVGDPQRQLAVRVGPATVQQAVRRTVHRFDARGTLLDLVECIGEEHVVAVVVVVPRTLPQLDIEDLRGDDLVVAVSTVLLTHELDEGVVNDRPPWVEERARRRLGVEGE